MSRLTSDERAVLAWASQPMVPAERREVLHFLGYPESLSSSSRERVLAVVERILELRGFEHIPTNQEEA